MSNTSTMASVHLVESERRNRSQAVQAAVIALAISGCMIAPRAIAAADEPTARPKSPPSPAKVEIRTIDGRYQLFRNGEPHYIAGAGLEFGSVESLAQHGGNSFRTWRAENGRDSGQVVLERAWRNGLSVTMGLEMAGERHGFDYDDDEAVARQFERVQREVLKYKDHPALIIWAIGNELNLNASNPRVWNAVNDISRKIHEVDPNHLTTTTLAGINKGLIQDIQQRAPDLDLICIQMYADLVNLPRYIQETGWKGPYIVSEWGATGHWEVGKTPWGAPLENNSSQKADLYHKRFQTAIESDTTQCLGSYVFLWGQKQERTPTWYGMFLESGEETEAVDVLHFIWKKRWPANRSPRLVSVNLAGKTAGDGIYLTSGQSYAATVSAIDSDQDTLSYRWDIKPESTDLKEGGDFESTPQSLPGLVNQQGQATIRMTAPDKSGAYRLFVYAFDGNGHAAHANLPFYVNE